MRRLTVLLLIVSLIFSSCPLMVSAAGPSSLDGPEPTVVVEDKGTVPGPALITSYIDMTFEEPTIVVKDGKAHVTVGELPPAVVFQFPQVPRKSMTLELPPTFRLVNVEVIPGDIKTVPLDAPISIEPSPYYVDLDGLAHIYDVPLTWQGELYPATWGEHSAGKGIGDGDKDVFFLSLRGHPVRVEGRTLYYTDHIVFKFTHYNAAQMSGTRDPATASRAGTEDYRLVIIGPAKYSTQINNLVSHKKALGLSTIWVDIQDIYSGKYFAVEGNTNQEKIKYFIMHAKENWSSTYVLLFGDVEDVPCYTINFDDGTWPSTVATDIYYADIYNADGEFSAWTGVGGTVWSFTAPDDLYMDIHIGRLPAGTTQEATTVVDKVVHYENDTKGQWFQNATLIGTDPFGGDNAGMYGTDHISNIIQNRFPNRLKLYTSNGTATATKIKDAINKGTAIVTYAGHGDTTYLAIGGGNSFSISDLSTTTNGYMLPIGSQAACLTGYYDGGSDSFSEYFVVKQGGGGVADMGSSRIAYGSQGPSWPYAVAGGHTTYLHQALVDGYLSAGSMFSKSHNDYMKNIGVSGGTDFKTMIEFNWFADPSMLIGVDMDSEIGQVPLLQPGQENTFQVKFTNHGFDMPVNLTADSRNMPPNWTITVSPKKVMVPKGDSRNVTVSIIPPLDAQAGITFDIPLLGLADTIGREILKDKVSVVVDKYYEISLLTDYPQAGKSFMPGDMVDLNLSVFNSGNTKTSADIELVSAPTDWNITLGTTKTTLEYKAKTKVDLQVQVPVKYLPSTKLITVRAKCPDRADVVVMQNFSITVKGFRDWDVAWKGSLDLSTGMGGNFTLPYTVTNEGNLPESVIMKVTPPDWLKVYFEPNAVVQPYSTLDDEMDLYVPDVVLAGDYDIGVEMKGALTNFAWNINLTIIPVPILDMAPITDETEIEAGDATELEYRLENRGNVPLSGTIRMGKMTDKDGYDWNYEKAGWDLELSQTSFDLDLQGYTSFLVDITTPVNALAGNYTMNVTVDSPYGNDLRQMGGDLRGVVTISQYHDIGYAIAGTETETSTGKVLKNMVTIVNNGNGPEPLTDLKVDVPKDWDYTLLSAEGKELGDQDTPVTGLPTLAAFSQGSIGIEVTVPEDALAGEYSYIVSIGTALDTKSFSAKVIVLQNYGLEINVSRNDRPVPEPLELKAGNEDKFQLRVTNLGNGEDDMGISLEGPTWASVEAPMLKVDPKETRSIDILLKPAKSVKGDTYTIKLTVNSKGGEVRTTTIKVKIPTPPPSTPMDKVLGNSGGVLGIGVLFMFLAVIIVIMMTGVIVAKTRLHKQEEELKRMYSRPKLINGQTSLMDTDPDRIEQMSKQEQAQTFEDDGYRDQ